jgi:hypothetical protein
VNNETFNKWVLEGRWVYRETELPGRTIESFVQELMNDARSGQKIQVFSFNGTPGFVTPFDTDVLALVGRWESMRYVYQITQYGRIY